MVPFVGQPHHKNNLLSFIIIIAHYSSCCAVVRIRFFEKVNGRTGEGCGGAIKILKDWGFGLRIGVNIFWEFVVYNQPVSL